MRFTGTLAKEIRTTARLGVQVARFGPSLVTMPFVSERERKARIEKRDGVFSEIRHVRTARLAYVGALIGRIMLGYSILSLRKRTMSEEAYAGALSAQHRRSAQWIYDVVVRLQGLMIKIGQTIGSRPDLVPEEYCRILSRLQDQVPPRPFREMRPHIEAQLGTPIEAAFAEFDPNPVAAASLAQVYRARLKDGRLVAVKVVYPDTERLVDTDLTILRVLIRIETRFWAVPLEPMYDELAANIPHEVDMIHEGRNMETLASMLSHRQEVVIPKVVWELTRSRVLTMDYIDGIRIADLDRVVEAGIDPKVLAQVVVDVYFEQMMKHGCFHADPHAGNLFALPGNRLAILDFGLIKQFTPEFRAAFKVMARAIFTGDDAGLAEAMRAAGFVFKHENRTDGVEAVAQLFRALADSESWKSRTLVEGTFEIWFKALKQNPLVEANGEIVLAMRVFSLLVGLAAITNAQADAVKTILKYSE